METSLGTELQAQTFRGKKFASGRTKATIWNVLWDEIPNI